MTPRVALRPTLAILESGLTVQECLTREDRRRELVQILPKTFANEKRASDVEALSVCGSERRRSESNRRMEVLQTSALPLGYGAEAGRS